MKARISIQRVEWGHSDVCCPQHGMWCVTTWCAHSMERSVVEPVSEGCWGGSEARGQSCVASCLTADSICPQRRANPSCSSTVTTRPEVLFSGCPSLWRSPRAHPVTLSVLFDPINNHLIPILMKNAWPKFLAFLMAESWLFLKPTFLCVSNHA